MTRARFTPVVLAGVVALVPAAGTPQSLEPRTIQVVGRGEASTSPDLAELGLAVETTAATAADAGRLNTERSRKVLETVRPLLGQGGRIETAHYSLSPRYGSRRAGSDAPPEIVGYVASNIVRAEIRDLERIGAVLDAAIAAGANGVNGLRFLLEDTAEARGRAIAEAGRDALAQAESIAAALGVELGEILAVSTSEQQVAPLRMERRLTAASAAEATPIEPGELTVPATLFVTYRIRD